MDWAAKASLASMRSMSSMVRPALASAALEAGTGPTPMIFGSTPPWPQPMILNRGFRPYLSTASWSAMRMAAAPSLMPEALAAVTRPPSGLKAGFSLPIFSMDTSPLMYSSVLNSTISFLTLTGTGTISSLKRPESRAAAAFFWESKANWSSSSRVMPHWSHTFSAVMPMW